MIRTMALVAVVVVACGRSGEPTCAARVSRMSAHLAAPREPAELARVSKRLAQAVAEVAAAEPAQRGATAAAALVPMLGPCPAAAEVLGGVAVAAGGPKDAYLRAQLPPALITCRCAASPEDAGALVELLFTTWR
ncbi:MAG: hypothetical protein JNK64_26745 [Myxococcales bacterium]|nr:hypothetical protein [Myxococcales bacterium]